MPPLVKLALPFSPETVTDTYTCQEKDEPYFSSRELLEDLLSWPWPVWMADPRWPPFLCVSLCPVLRLGQGVCVLGVLDAGCTLEPLGVLKDAQTLSQTN